MSTPKIYSKTTIRLLIILTGIALMGSSCNPLEPTRTAEENLDHEKFEDYEKSSQAAFQRYWDWFKLQNKYFQDTQAEARDVIDAYYRAKVPCLDDRACSAASKDKYDHLSQLITSQYDLDQSAEQNRCIARESNCRENQRWALMNDPLYGKISPVYIPPGNNNPETGTFGWTSTSEYSNREAQGAQETQILQYNNMNQQGVPVVPVVPVIPPG